MRARLTLESGLASPRVFDLDDSRHVVHLGRNRENTIVLQDRHASRWHARLYLSNGRWILVDQETTNGTRLDDQPITGEARLADGQVIGIGEVRMRFQLADPIVEE